MKRITLSIATIGAVLLLGLGPAAAQDGQTITIDPATVDAAGEAEFAVSGSGFTAAPPYAIVPCFTINTPEGLVDIDVEATCDVSQVVLVTAADGWTETVTFDVPAEGMCLVVGTLDGAEGGGACIAVGAADEGGEEAGEEDTEGAAEEETLANTGVESALLAVIAVAVLAAGAMLSSTRRFARN